MAQLTGSFADEFAMLMQSNSLPAQCNPPRQRGLIAQYTPTGPSNHDGYNSTP